MQVRFLQSPRWLPIIVWAACMLFTLTVWRVLRAHERKQAEHLLESSLVSAMTRISAHLDGAVIGMTRMTRHWERDDDLSRLMWEADVKAHIADEPGFICVGWVTISRDLRWLVPPAREPLFRQCVLDNEGAAPRAIWESQSDRRVAFAGGLEIERTRPGFLIAIPIHTGGKQSGSIVSMIGVQAFMDTIFGIDGDPTTWVEISEGTSTIYRGGAEPGRNARRWMREHDFDLPGLRWHVRILPGEALLAKAQSILPDLVLTVGTLMACLVSLTVYLGYTAGLQARELQTLNTELENRVAQRTTDLREANERLQAQALSLAQSNDDLQQFAYVASHDLQEPLRMVSSYMELIQRRYSDRLDDEGLEFMRYAVDGSERMRVLINDLLDYARLDTASQQPEPVASGSALQLAIENLEFVIKETEAQIEADPLPTVMGDLGQLARLFQNFISNAIKFKGDRKPQIKIQAVRIGARQATDETLHEGLRLSLEDAPGTGVWHFSVNDNSIGIDPSFAERIFVIFQRLHAPDDYPGTGIGLAICKKIVERHGGRIWVDSEPGKGSTFHFTLREPPKARNRT